eukprot:evm.model.scf_217.10 EVM.evm.TU.scf_217.10   scf_217:94369-94860(-)
MAEEADAWVGHCLCGGVELSIKKSCAPAIQTYCHCEDCTRYHSNSVVPYVMFPYTGPGDPNVVVTKGRDLLTKFNYTPRVDRKFCSRCGSPVVNYVVEGPNLCGTFPRVMCDMPFEPTMHLYCGEALGTDKALGGVKDGLPRYKDLPSEYGGSGLLLDVDAFV